MKKIQTGIVVLLTMATVAVVLISCERQQGANIVIEPKRKDSIQAAEQPNPYATHDQSPLDMSYFPPDYPILRMNGTDSGSLMARVIYSRPRKKGRNVFGSDPKNSLREFCKEWRLGANEATEIEFFKQVRINNKKVDKGRYIIYCIPYPDKWTVVLNSNLYTWGLHMDETKDVFKTEVPVQKQIPALEDFTMVFEKSGDHADLIMAWDTVKVIMPIISN
jgi:hypothetical protein